MTIFQVLQYFTPLILLVFVAAFTPGPNNIMLMSSGLNFGIRKGIPHVLGIICGFNLLVFLSLMGISFIFEQVKGLKFVTQTLGSLYLLYLAYKISPYYKFYQKGTGTSKKETEVNGNEVQKNTRPISFFQAFSFQIINPKAITMMLLFPSIVVVDTRQRKIIFMSIVLLSTAGSAFTWLIGGKILQKIVKNSRALYTINLCSALLLVVTVVLIYLK